MWLPRALLFGVTCLLAAMADAAPTPSSSLTGAVSLNFSGNTQSLGATALGPSLLIKQDPLGFVSLGATGIPSPLLQAVVNIGPGIAGPNGAVLINGLSSRLLTYFFQIVSPIKTTIPITIDVAGAISGDSTLNSDRNTFFLDARWALFEPPFAKQLTSDVLVSVVQAGQFHDDFSRTVNLMIETNFIYQVIMTVKAEGTVRDLGAFANAVATIDPVFSLGAGVDPASFAFEFSSGIGNSPVPLPSPLLLLGGGLFALSPCRRSRARSRISGG